jgi:hypothetical protein
MCTQVQVCDAVHSGAHRKLFLKLIRPDASRVAKTRSAKTRQSKNHDSEFLKSSGSSKVKIVASKSRTFALRPVACSPSQSAAKLSAPSFAAPRRAAQTCTARKTLFHLNSAPHEATTSIWLKAMMVRRDLRGKTEPLETESGTEVERWRIEPEGCTRAKSGLIRLTTRSASALYFRGNLHARWGIQLGDTVSPCVSPSVSPYARWPDTVRHAACAERGLSATSLA